MGFYLKKLISYWIDPYSIVILTMIIGVFFLFFRKELLSKIFLSISLIFLLLFSFPIFSNVLVENLENKYPKYDYKKRVTYIHVLGAGFNDGDFALSSKLSDASTKRILEGVIIHKKILGSKLVLTGYKGCQTISNAEMYAKLAIALGVKAEDIIKGELTKDTKEEAIFMKNVLKENNDEFVLVTSAIHMPRAINLFKSIGLNPIAAPTDFHKLGSEKHYVLDSESMAKSGKAIHEYVGILWIKLLEVLK